MGRHQKVDSSEVVRLRQLGYTLDDIAKRMEVTRQAIIKTLEKVKDKGEIGVRI